MQMQKKLTAGLLAAALTIGAADLSGWTQNIAHAETLDNGLYYMIVGGEASITGFSDEAETYEIPAEINGSPVTSIGQNAFKDNDTLTAITLPKTITQIGDGAFSYCDGITEITLPEKLTTIGASAFSYCGSLSKITMPDTVTSIGNEAFKWSQKLSDISLSNTLVSIGASAFDQCTALNSITMPDTVETIGAYAFSSTPIEEIHLSNSLTELGTSTFAYCENLKSIEIPEGIESIPSECFTACSSLSNIKLPNSLKCIDSSAFSYCTSLETITLPDNLEIINSWAFESCTALHEITIPASVQEMVTSAFNYCNKLTVVQVLNPYIEFSGYSADSTPAYYGYDGSTTEKFAEKYNLTFISLGAIPSELTTTETTTTTTTTTTASRLTTTTTTSSRLTTTTTTTSRLITPTTTSTRATTTVYFADIQGDVNADNSLTISDAVLLARVINEDKDVTLKTYAKPDVNKDGKVDLKDLQKILWLLRPMSITLGKAAAKPGETITVPVMIYNDHGTAGGAIYIGYDAALTPKAVRAGDAYTDITLDETVEGYPVYFAWATKDGKNQCAENGAVIAYIDFEVSEYINYNTMLSVFSAMTPSFADEKGSRYSVSTGSGYVAAVIK